MKLVLTIHEPSPERAVEAIRAVGARPRHGGGARSMPSAARRVDFAALRAATARPMIVTNRGGAPVDFAAAYGAGIELVDVEFGHDPGPLRDRVVLSHHDFESVPTSTRWRARCARSAARTPRSP